MANVIQTAELLHDLETGEIFDQKDDADKKWWEKFGTVTLLTLGMGAASMLFNLLALIFYYSSSVVYPMALLALVLAPIVMMRQIQMEDKGGMRRLQNKLRENVNDLSRENTKLSGQVNQLETQVKELEGVEEGLAEVVQDSQQDVNSFTKLVKENGAILDQFKVSKTTDLGCEQISFAHLAPFSESNLGRGRESRHSSVS